MNFASNEFIVFLLVVWGSFLALPQRFRAPLLLLASYYFYATWSLPFVVIILITTSTDYIASKLIFNSPSPSTRKAVLWAALTVNLCVLGFFKYCNFFLDATHSAIKTIGWHTHIPAHLDIILPLGISYYTFEAISYLMDVYRGSKPSKSWMEYNFYIMFFPHLISGPIIRFNELAPQYAKPLETPSKERICKGIELIVLGYIFKVVIANSCVAIADPIFGAPLKATVLETYLGALAFTTQVYFDFMGYTHIARGVSLLFNIELPLNFNHPFTASNISNFWERWQISLTRWIKDYIFIPLGGTRRSFPRVLLNLFLIMFICGVWHGSGWRYVIWGAYYGVLVVAYHSYKKIRGRLFGVHEQAILKNKIYSIGSTLLTFTAVYLACVIFRAAAVPDAMTMFSKMTQFGTLLNDMQTCLATTEYTIFGLFTLLLLCCFAGPLAERIYTAAMQRVPYFFKVQLVTAAATASWVFCAPNMQPFIYFQF
ncbi:MAG TPA: MBOAT family O-acyltransferase [Trichormus sp.]|jgi:alginate O-acetyltransferase complex protein AlgI